jgi:hypothetical protein
MDSVNDHYRNDVVTMSETLISYFVGRFYAFCRISVVEKNDKECCGHLTTERPVIFFVSLTGHSLKVYDPSCGVNIIRLTYI